METGGPWIGKLLPMLRSASPPIGSNVANGWRCVGSYPVVCTHSRKTKVFAGRDRDGRGASAALGEGQREGGSSWKEKMVLKIGRSTDGKGHLAVKMKSTFYESFRYARPAFGLEPIFFNGMFEGDRLDSCGWNGDGLAISTSRSSQH